MMTLGRLAALCAWVAVLPMFFMAQTTHAAMLHISPAISLARAILHDSMAIYRAAMIVRLPNGAGESDDARELWCLAEAIYFEARGEPERGQLAVGRVVINRAESGRYPDSICGVVYQNAHKRNRCQFSFACDGKPETITDTASWRAALAGARRLMACEAECREEPGRSGSVWVSTHYHADYVSPSWAKKLRRTGRIGRHIFYAAGTA
jgi:spore germination cell wall hydrolase CwlJ-like protein